MLREILKYGSILTVGNIVAGILSLVFMIIAARALGPDDFGALAALLSLFYVAALPLDGGIGTLVAQRIAKARSDNPQLDVTPIVRSAALQVGKLSLSALLIYLLLSSTIANFLKMDSPRAVMLLGFCGFIFSLYAVIRGALQGLRMFRTFAAGRVGEAFVRLAGLLALMPLRVSVTGALSAYAVGYLTMIPALGLRMPINWRAVLVPESMRASKGPTRHAYATGLAFVISAAIMQLDMVAARHYLPGDVAGYYGAACSLVKTSFSLVAVGFAMAMFPSVVAAGARSGAALRMLAAAIGASTLAMAVGVAACFLLPHQIITIVLAERYAPLAQWLGFFALASVAPALLGIITRYYIALHTKALLAALSAGLVLQIASFALYHATPQSLMVGLTLGNSLPLIGLAVYAAACALPTRKPDLRG